MSISLILSEILSLLQSVTFSSIEFKRSDIWEKMIISLKYILTFFFLTFI